MIRDSYTGISLCLSKQQTQPLTRLHKTAREGSKKMDTTHHVGFLSGQITYCLEGQRKLTGKTTLWIVTWHQTRAALDWTRRRKDCMW